MITTSKIDVAFFFQILILNRAIESGNHNFIMEPPPPSRSPSPTDDDIEAGIYDVSQAPIYIVDQVSEAKMRFAIYNTVPDGIKMNICILPTTIVTIQPNRHVFINNIMDDPRIRWIMRGVGQGVKAFVTRHTEVTRFTFHTRGEHNQPRNVYLFVRVYPPHFVEIGTNSNSGDISLRIEQITDVFGDAAELCIAAGEEQESICDLSMS